MSQDLTDFLRASDREFLRSGDSPRARFFRWKDEFTARYERTGVDPTTVSAYVNRAWGEIRDDWNENAFTEEYYDNLRLLVEKFYAELVEAGVMKLKSGRPTP